MKNSIILILILLLAAVTYAQKKPNATDEQIKARLTAIVYEIDSKLKPVFAKNEKLQGQMQQELKALAKITDVKRRSAAIAAYQAKYKSSYGALLREAGVDMAKYTRDLNTSFPSHQFILSDNFGIAGKLRAGTAALPIPAKPVSTPVTGYLAEKHTGCGGIAGGTISSSPNSFTGTSFCAVAGGCNNYGFFTKDVLAPQQASAVLKVSHKARVEAFAAGVAGLASSYASTTCTYGSRSTSLSVTAIAPLLWVAYAEDEEVINSAYTINAGRTSQISYGVYVASASALPGESNSKASITDINNILTTQ